MSALTMTQAEQIGRTLGKAFRQMDQKFTAMIANRESNSPIIINADVPEAEPAAPVDMSLVAQAVDRMTEAISEQKSMTAQLAASMSAAVEAMNSQTAANMAALESMSKSMKALLAAKPASRKVMFETDIDGNVSSAIIE